MDPGQFKPVENLALDVLSWISAHSAYRSLCQPKHLSLCMSLPLFYLNLKIPIANTQEYLYFSHGGFLLNYIHAQHCIENQSHSRFSKEPEWTIKWREKMTNAFTRKNIFKYSLPTWPSYSPESGSLMAPGKPLLQMNCNWNGNMRNKMGSVFCSPIISLKGIIKRVIGFYSSVW